MYDFTMTIMCADWTVGKDVEGLTYNVCDEYIIRHHVPVIRKQPGEPLKQGGIDGHGLGY